MATTSVKNRDQGYLRKDHLLLQRCENVEKMEKPSAPEIKYTKFSKNRRPLHLESFLEVSDVMLFRIGNMIFSGRNQ